MGTKVGMLKSLWKAQGHMIKLERTAASEHLQTKWGDLFLPHPECFTLPTADKNVLGRTEMLWANICMTGRADSQKYKILIKTVFKAGGSYWDDRTSSSNSREDGWLTVSAAISWPTKLMSSSHRRIKVTCFSGCSRWLTKPTQTHQQDLLCALSCFVPADVI